MTTTRPADWKEFDDFASGIATNRLPKTDALAGREIAISLDDKRHIKLTFETSGRITWRERDASATEVGEVIEVAPHTYFVDYTIAARPSEDQVFVFNTFTCRVLSIAERVRDAAEASGEPRVAQSYVAGIVADGGEVTGHAPTPTRDLVGLTAHYDYSPNHLYEHIYLSSQRYAWQNLVGVQRGHGDVDMATTFKFAEGQYVFGFREFIIPVASLFFYNWQGMRSTGKFLGVTKSGAVENKPAGAHIIKKSQVQYEPGKEPV
jgi:MoaF C-terminal domain/MoaF N-terminal domain